MKPAVLVVDDDQAMCELIEAWLSRSMAVNWRTNPAAALDLLRDGPFDVVLTDVRMRGMSGADVCRSVGEMRPDVPVVVMTAFGSIETAAEVMRAGAYDFVTKPIEMEALIFSLERAHQASQLRREVRRLRSAAATTIAQGALIGTSPAMRQLQALIARVATSDVSVLITGESGSGKEVVARAIHAASARAASPFVAVNCSAIPESLLESELFGHARGAFTDAKAAHCGLFAQAHGGTLLLDEIGDMPLGLQPKLLRALQERSVRPLGGSSEVATDVRVIAATNHDIEDAIADKRFREDLYYRLNVVEIGVPPLRARGEDVLLLAQCFLERAAGAGNKQVLGMTPAVAEHLRGYAWPGNVRELSNVMERAVALTRFEELVVDDLPDRLRSPTRKQSGLFLEASEAILPLEEIERRYVLHAFEALGRNRSLTAQMLGIDRKTLYRKLEKWAPR